MSVHNRQRRRPQRQNRPQHSTEQPHTDAAVAETDTYTETSPAEGESVLPTASTRTTALLRGKNRPAAPRSVAPPLDYTREYQHARTDLRWITLWAVILFGLMFALRFSGLV